MKLSLSRTLAVAFALTIGIIPAFAQLTFNGYYRVGAADNIDGSSNQTAAFFDRLRLNVSFAAPDDMYGFKTRLEVNSWDSATAGTPAILALFTDKASAAASAVTGSTAAAQAITVSPLVALKYGQAYGKFLDGVLKVTIGRLDVTDYMVTQNIGNIYLGNVSTDETAVKASLLGAQLGTTTGALLQVWPLEGLSVAASVKTDTNGKALGLHNIGIDAYYLMTGIGKVLFSSQAMDDSDLSKSFASAGFSYTGFKGLTATAAYRYYGMAPGTAQASGAVAIVEYNVAPFFVDVATDVDMTNSHYYVEGEVAYTIIPQIKVRGYGAYTDNAAAGAGANGNINIRNGAMASGQKTTNQYLLGADLVFPVGKAEVSAGLAYGDKGNIQIPILVKANF